MTLLRRATWRARLSGTGIPERLREARAFQRASREEIQRERDARLSRLLIHAYEKVPYYREALRGAGVVETGPAGRSEVRLERFTQLQPLDKSVLRERFDDLTSEDVEKRGAFVVATGGSTGEPVRCLHDREMHAWKVASKNLFDGWTGFRYGDRFTMLWGAVGDLSNQSLRARLGVWLRNELRLEALRLTPEKMNAYVDRLNRFRPKLMLAYAQSAYQLAKHAETAGLHVEPIPAVMTSATNLEPEMRSTIERVFGTRVYDRYGSREVADVACENGDGHGLVINPLTHYIEVVDRDGAPLPAGEHGELLVTTLTNLSMPLIRYRIGDTGVLGEEREDGIRWPRLAEVSGRVTDVFYRLDGGQVYGGYFTRQFYAREWVAQFQVVQEDFDSLLVRLVPRAGTDPSFVREEQAALSEAFKEAMGDSCEVRFEVVEQIPVGPTGKLRYTISHVAPAS